jgi:hypothetical protein
MLKQSFRDFIFSTNTDGGGKAASYVRALDILGPILTRYYPRPIIRGTMWQRFSLSDIQAIHKWICAETPRVKKRKQEQERRTAQKTEVFTPSWICNELDEIGAELAKSISKERGDE